MSAAGGWRASAAEVAPKRPSEPRLMFGSRASHVLVDVVIARGLRDLSASTRVTQAQYLREALADLLAKHSGRRRPAIAPAPRLDGKTVSVVFRVSPEAMVALVDLASRTRVRQSEYIREALMDLLEKHGRGVRA